MHNSSKSKNCIYEAGICLGRQNYQAFLEVQWKFVPDLPGLR